MGTLGKKTSMKFLSKYKTFHSPIAELVQFTNMEQYAICRVPGPVESHYFPDQHCFAWWRHQMETFSALLAIRVSGEFPAQRPVTRSFDVFFDLRLNKRLSKQLGGWWFGTLSRPLWCPRNVNSSCISYVYIKTWVQSTQRQEMHMKYVLIP